MVQRLNNNADIKRQNKNIILSPNRTGKTKYYMKFYDLRENCFIAGIIAAKWRLFCLGRLQHPVPSGLTT